MKTEVRNICSFDHIKNGELKKENTRYFTTNYKFIATVEISKIQISIVVDKKSQNHGIKDSN